MYFYKIIIIVFLSGLTRLASSSNINYETIDKIKFINDIVLFEGRPTQIIAYLCWESTWLKQLVKAISKNERVSGIAVNSLDDYLKPEHGFRHNLLFVVDTDCEKTIEIILKANDLKLFLPPHRWLILNLNNSDMKPVLSGINAYLRSDVTLVDTSKCDDLDDINLVAEMCWKIFQYYKISPNKIELQTEKYGRWYRNNDKKSAYNIQDDRSSPIISRRRYSLQKSIFRATYVVVNNESLVNYKTDKDLHIDPLFKMCARLTDSLFAMMNITLNLRITDSYGYRKRINASSDSFYIDGQVGELGNNLTDLGASSCMMSPDRANIAQFLIPTTRAYGALVFRAPPLTYMHNLFTLPFSMSIWISSAIVIVFMTFLLYGAVLWEWFVSKGVEDDLIDSNFRLHPTYTEVVMLGVGVICQQGSFCEPNKSSGRLVMFFFLIFLMFLYISYSAHIVVLLQSTSTSIRTIQDLVDSNLGVVAEDTIYFRYYLVTNPDPVKLELGRKKKPKFVTPAEGFAAVRHDRVAFLSLPLSSYKIVQETYLEHEKCDFQEIDFLDAGYFYTQTQYNSEYLEILKIGYMKMMERGIQSAEFQRLFTEKPKCVGSVSHFTSVTIDDIYSAFLLLVCGVALAFMAYIIEYYYAKRKVASIHQYPEKMFEKIKAK